MIITRNYSFVEASIIMGLLLIVSVTLLPNLSFAQQENQTNMTSSQQQNQSGVNQTGGGQEGQNQTQQGPLEQLGETLGGIFGGGN